MNEIFSTVLEIIGIITLTAGLFITFGLGISLIVFGCLSLAYVVTDALFTKGDN